MSRNAESKHNKIGLRAVVGNLVQLVLVAGLVSLAVLTFGTKIPYLSRLGLNFFAVTSGSMEPTIPVGSVIYSGKYSLDTLKAGDIITFILPVEGASKPTLVTHRIAVVNKQETKSPDSDRTQVSYEFTTKGDANNADDELPVMSGNVLGLYKWHVPRLGYLTSFIQTPNGFMVFIILPAIILIVWEVLSLILHFKHQYEEKSATEIAKLKAELTKSETHEK